MVLVSVECVEKNFPAKTLIIIYNHALITGRKNWTKVIKWTQYTWISPRPSTARLLVKMENYGITGKILGWCKHFLSDRRQRIVINGEKSAWKRVIWKSAYGKG